jgi:hypothetical protein
MIKQVEIHGQRVKLHSLDQGRTWSSSPESIVAYGQRKQRLRRELKKTFERLGEIHDPDPNTLVAFGIRKSPTGY